MGIGDHSETVLILGLFDQSTPSWIKVRGWGGGPCDFSVSPSPFGLDFGTLDFGLGLDNKTKLYLILNTKHLQRAFV